MGVGRMKKQRIDGPVKRNQIRLNKDKNVLVRIVGRRSTSTDNVYLVERQVEEVLTGHVYWIEESIVGHLFNEMEVLVWASR